MIFVVAPGSLYRIRILEVVEVGRFAAMAVDCRKGGRARELLLFEDMIARQKRMLKEENGMSKVRWKMIDKSKKRRGSA